MSSLQSWRVYTVHCTQSASSWMLNEIRIRTMNNAMFSIFQVFLDQFFFPLNAISHWLRVWNGVHSGAKNGIQSKTFRNILAKMKMHGITFEPYPFIIIILSEAKLRIRMSFWQIEFFTKYLRISNEFVYGSHSNVQSSSAQIND